MLRQHEVDVVHVSFSFSSLDFNLPKLCHQLGIPIVGTFHVPFGQRPTVWSLTTSAVYRLYAQALAECNAVIIFSDLQREILVSLGVPREVIQVLPNGVDVDKYAPGESAKRAHFNEQDLAARIHPDDVGEWRRKVLKTAATGGTYSHQYRIIRNDNVIWVRAKGQCILDKSGRPERFPGVVIDITSTRHPA